MKNFSLKLRLSIILLFLFAISSIIAISISMYQTKKTLVEVLDTQLYYFAKRVVNSNINTLINSSNLNYELNNINEDIAEKYMSIEDDSLTYAIYSLDGKIIYKDFSEENNDNFVFNNNYHSLIISVIDSSICPVAVAAACLFLPRPIEASGVFFIGFVINARLTQAVVL